MTLEDMKDLLILPNITFVDLQYTDTSDERAEFKKKYGVEIVKLKEIDNFNDIDGLASLIDACDFVVSVSNTTAHISGAIGKKTYLMLPKNRGQLWYWSKENSKSIWYKSIEIFERNNFSSWETVIKKNKAKFRKVILMYLDYAAKTLNTMINLKKDKDYIDSDLDQLVKLTSYPGVWELKFKQEFFKMINIIMMIM